MFLKMATISINSIYRMVFVMQMQCDFCEIKKLFIFNQWTQSLYKHTIHLHVIHVSVYCGHHPVYKTYTITLRSIHCTSLHWPAFTHCTNKLQTYPLAREDDPHQEPCICQKETKIWSWTGRLTVGRSLTPPSSSICWTGFQFSSIW
jgi:hypothetical protein